MSVAFDLSSLERRLAQIAATGEPLAIAAPAAASSALEPRAARFAAHAERAAAALVSSAALRAHVDPALALAVASVESGFDPRAVSASGAIGLMQLMPGTAQALGVANPYDSAQNVRGGATYLRELLDRFGGDVSSAVAAYNAGPAAVELSRGAPPYPETQRYVARVLDAYRTFGGDERAVLHERARPL